MGCRLSERMILLDLGEGGLMGMVVYGGSRSGKWEMRGVFGGAGIKENSVAREVRGVWVSERAKMTLTPLDMTLTRDCGEMSAA